MADETRDVQIEVVNKVNDDLAGTTALQFEGAEFDPSRVTEWIRFTNLGYVGQLTPPGTRRERWLMQFDCFTKVGQGQETHWRAWELVDAVKGTFDDLGLTVRSWTGGTPGAAVATLIFDVGRADPLPARPEEPLLQHVAVTYRPILWT